MKRSDYLHYVNIKQDTASEPRFSTGNTLPLVTVPFGMNAFCLQTSGKSEGWFYHPGRRQTESVQLTHQLSPWVRDYGCFVMMPQSGECCISEDARSSGFEEIAMSPACMALYFRRYRCYLDLAPTMRGAVMKIRWDTEDTPRFSLLPFDCPTYMHLNAEKGELSGWLNARGDGTREDFRMYFCMQFDAPINTQNTFLTRNSGKTKTALRGEDMGVGMSVAFLLPRGNELTVLLATSFVSAEQAALNLAREVGGKSYEDICCEAANQWNDLLSRIEITDTEAAKRTFYSCMYRCFLFPHTFHELDEQGNPIHYSTKSGDVRKGVMYTDNGFWDTCRTLYPLFNLLIPDKCREMMEGYLNFFREEGWLPKWVSPGERGIMPGTLIDAVLADAAVKGILTQEQAELALDSMLKNASVPSGNHLNGRRGVADYLALGYIPSDRYGESVNNTLDAYYCDFCIAQLAKHLGKEELSREYLLRARNYEILFDASVGFIRGRKADGSRAASFSPTVWGGEYCEGAAWQNAFGVYHDVDGLAALYGGREQLATKLNELFATPSVFETGTYPCEIHEMPEMSAAGFGQCAISNQPSFHIPYLYSALGYPQNTAYWVRKIMDESFSEHGFPGDEDNGSMSAWYVFSSLGFYPLCTGKAEYVAGNCSSDCVALHLGNGKTLTIRRKETPEQTVISHEQIMEGGEISL